MPSFLWTIRLLWTSRVYIVLLLNITLQKRIFSVNPEIITVTSLTTVDMASTTLVLFYSL